MTLRVGNGFDVHAFTDDAERVLVLGGITLAGERGLQGHSDADVVAHAVADSLLGAAGLGDLGSHFPETHPAFAGIDSMEILAEVVRHVEVAGWRPCNVDCTVVLEAPKLRDVRVAMQERMTSVVGAPVHVKASTAERLGALGRGEGIACLAVALLESA